MSLAITKVGVLGMGLMGSGIAQLTITKGFPTLVVDLSQELLNRGVTRVREGLQRFVKKTKGSNKVQSQATSIEPETILSLLRTSTQLGELLACDIVIEAIIENESAKKEAIRSVSGLGYRSLLVSNTSSISITRLANAYACPEQFMGMHFMNPVPVQPGCELIRGFVTSNDTAGKIISFCRALGKEPIFAEDKAGFGLNRMFVPFLLEAVKVVEEGVMSCEDADKTTICLGHKMGPITTLDFVGLDTVLAIGDVLQSELGPRYAVPDLLRKLVTAGFFGIKSSKGFYVWDDGEKKEVNPVVLRYRRRDL
jgi:3-hydroxybutyryl-CoA dehydrogenase